MRVDRAMCLTCVLALLVGAGTLSFGQAATEAGAAAQKVQPPAPNPAGVQEQQAAPAPAANPTPAQAAPAGPSAASAQAPEGGPAPLRVMVG